MDRIADGADQSVSFAAYTTATGAAVTVTSATAGLALWYRRGGTGAKVPLTTLTTPAISDLATLETAHTDGGILVVGGAEHRLDLPDAAFAVGVPYVEWGGEATGITIDGGTANLIGQATTGPVGAYALQSADTGATAVARTGADGDTLETLSDQIDGVPAATEAVILDEGDATALLAAIGAKVEEFLINEGDATATIAAIATACNAAVAAGAIATELAKVPKSDGTATWNATALASINAEVDTALTDDARLAVLIAQREIDTTTTPWQLVLKDRTTGAELYRFDLTDANGDAIAAIDTFVAGQTTPA